MAKNAPKIKIRKGDSVQVIAGKDSGKRGTVARVIPEKRRVVVEKVNMIKRHTKPRPAPRNSQQPAGDPGRCDREGGAAAHLKRAARVPGMRQAVEDRLPRER